MVKTYLLPKRLTLSGRRTSAEVSALLLLRPGAFSRSLPEDLKLRVPYSYNVKRVERITRSAPSGSCVECIRGDNCTTRECKQTPKLVLAPTDYFCRCSFWDGVFRNLCVWFYFWFVSVIYCEATNVCYIEDAREVTHVILMLLVEQRWSLLNKTRLPTWLFRFDMFAHIKI